MSSQPSIYFCNGKYLPAHRATISVHDLGLLRGFGLFEALRTYDGQPFLLKAHLDRLFHGAKAIGLKSPLTHSNFKKVITRLLRKNHFDESLIRIILTGGPSDGFLPQKKPTVVILVDPFHPFPSWQYQKGISLMTAPAGRILPEIKSTIYFAAVMQTMKAVRWGFTEVVYVDEQGALLEGTTYNVFAVLAGSRLVTPQNGILAGITAACVLNIARRLHIPVLRKPITPRFLRQSKELFITSSNRELISVIRVNHMRIGNGRPGPVTQQIHMAYQKLTQDLVKKS